MIRNLGSSQIQFSSLSATSHEAVRDVQQALNKLDPGLRLAETGVFDKKTHEALKTFQSKVSLPQSGSINQETIDSLNSSLKKVQIRKEPEVTRERIEKKGTGKYDLHLDGTLSRSKLQNTERAMRPAALELATRLKEVHQSFESTLTTLTAAGSAAGHAGAAQLLGGAPADAFLKSIGSSVRDLQRLLPIMAGGAMPPMPGSGPANTLAGYAEKCADHVLQNCAQLLRTPAQEYSTALAQTLGDIHKSSHEASSILLSGGMKGAGEKLAALAYVLAGAGKEGNTQAAGKALEKQKVVGIVASVALVSIAISVAVVSLFPRAGASAAAVAGAATNAAASTALTATLTTVSCMAALSMAVVMNSKEILKAAGFKDLASLGADPAIKAIHMSMQVATIVCVIAATVIQGPVQLMQQAGSALDVSQAVAQEACNALKKGLPEGAREAVALSLRIAETVRDGIQRAM